MPPKQRLRANHQHNMWLSGTAPPEISLAHGFKTCYVKRKIKQAAAKATGGTLNACWNNPFPFNASVKYDVVSKFDDCGSGVGDRDL